MAAVSMVVNAESSALLTTFPSEVVVKRFELSSYEFQNYVKNTAPFIVGLNSFFFLAAFNGLAIATSPIMQFPVTASFLAFTMVVTVTSVLALGAVTAFCWLASDLKADAARAVHKMKYEHEYISDKFAATIKHKNDVATMFFSCAWIFTILGAVFILATIAVIGSHWLDGYFISATLSISLAAIAGVLLLGGACYAAAHRAKLHVDK